jgi:hypothetical protein
MKQAGRVYASIASEIYDVPREVTLRNEDGSEKTAMVMESVFDYESGEEVILKDITKGAFDVVVDTGPSYTTQRDQVRAEMGTLARDLQGTPIGEMSLLWYIMMLDGPQTKGIRDYAKEQLMIMGQIEPETPEEKQKLQQVMQQQAEQAQQPDANTLLAMAEMEKAKADQADAQNDQVKIQVSAYDAETKRLKAMADIEKAGIEAQKTATEISGNELDNIQKLAKTLIPSTMQ